MKVGGATVELTGRKTFRCELYMHFWVEDRGPWPVVETYPRLPIQFPVWWGTTEEDTGLDV